MIFYLLGLSSALFISDVRVSSETLSGYTGALINHPMVPFSDIQGDNLNEGIAPSPSGIYVKYAKSNSTDSTIVLDVTIREWPDWKVNCPNGYTPSGQITIGAIRHCKKFGLCVFKVGMDELGSDDSVVTGIAISKYKGDTVWNYDQLTNFLDQSNVHEGRKCGDDNVYQLLVQRNSIDQVVKPELSDLEKKAIMIKYAPMVMTHPDEEYFASSITHFLNGTDRKFEKEWYLEARERDFNSPFYRGSPSPPLYSFYLQRSPSVFDIVYVAFYPFNEGKKVIFTFGDHVGDLEHSAIRFINNIPTTLAIQHHSFIEYYYFKNPEISRTGDQVHIWQAKGSHGFWNEPGKHVYHPAPIKLVDDCESGQIWNGRMGLEGFDVNERKALPGNTEFMAWPFIFDQDGVEDPNNGNEDSRSGSVKIWGGVKESGCVAGHCRIERGPDGIPFKSWFSQNTLRD